MKIEARIELEDGVLHIKIPFLRVVKRERISIGQASRLTRREQQILEGVMNQKQNKEIADAHDIAERTVKFHVSTLLRKFDVRSRVALREKFLGLGIQSRDVGKENFNPYA